MTEVIPVAEAPGSARWAALWPSLSGCLSSLLACIQTPFLAEGCRLDPQEGDAVLAGPV